MICMTGMIGLIGTIGLLALGLGCGARQAGEGTGDGSDESSCVPWTLCGEEGGDCWTSYFPHHAVDILVVVDGNAGSQAAQARLADGLDALVATLEGAVDPIDWRIAVTTTDMGPDACDPIATTPERGELIASSCRERLSEFVDAEGQDFTALCSERCELDSLDFLAHPWLERDGEVLDLPEGVTPAEALRCMAMSGVGSCRFESPLAAIEAAIVGSGTAGHANEGFFRRDAPRVFVVVSDAFDCSWTAIGQTILDPEGERTFWSDPLAEAATPAACWNAGTDCHSQNGVQTCDVGFYDASGTPVGAPDKYVLTRPGDLADWLRLSADWKDDFLFLVGVPVEGYDALAFTPSDDPAFMLEHGIGPGCEGPEGTRGLPPVRVHQFLREYIADTDKYAKSICSPSYVADFELLGARVVDQADAPTCMSRACDVDPSTPQLEVDCELYGQALGGPEVLLEECARAADGSYLVDPITGRPAMPRPEATLCYLVQTDSTQRTPDPLDDSDPRCLEWSAPGSFELVTLDGRSTDLFVHDECLLWPF